MQPGNAPTVRLAFGGAPQIVKSGLCPRAPGEPVPALLVSYIYLPQFEKLRPSLAFRDWVLDSGAFSAYNSGVEVGLQEYIALCQRLLATDLQLKEVFALDVIGDWRASLRNCEEMWRQNVPAIPCFHAGEPWEALAHMARVYPKIALGGVAYANSNAKLRWAEQCFARVWPKRIHGFGFGSERQLLALPWHSVDATTWMIGPSKYGRWQAYGGRMSVRGSEHTNLRAEVDWYIELEKRARFRWREQMRELEAPEEKATCSKS